MGQIMRQKRRVFALRRTQRWREVERRRRSCNRTRAGVRRERGKSTSEGVTSSRPLPTPQPGGPEELRAGESVGGEYGRSSGRFGEEGGDIDVVERRGMGREVSRRVRIRGQQAIQGQ